MAQWQNSAFDIPKLPDADLLDRTITAVKEADLNWQSAELQLEVGSVLRLTPADFQNDATLAALRGSKATAVRTLSVVVESQPKPITVSIVRSTEAGRLADRATLQLDGLNHPRRPEEPSSEWTAKFTALLLKLKEHLGALDTQSALTSFVDADMQRHYEAREIELKRLERIVGESLETISKGTAQIRASLDEEYRERNRTLTSEIDALRRSLRNDFEERDGALRAREKALADKLAEIDDRDARFVRRELRKNLKEELARSFEKFELTAGTRGLRQPIFVFSIVLLLLFGAGAISYAVISLNMLTDSSGVSQAAVIAAALKQLAFTAGFASTAVFFIRWNNRWFEQHAAEEFRLKRLNLDLDRASWIVEMAMEWDKEKGAEIPAVLVDRLTANLFGETTQVDTPLHPADQLASALLGSSAEASLELPGGSQLKFDRKGIRRLSRLGDGQKATSEPGA